jgi:transcription elongation GreA/GreB family factor
MTVERSVVNKAELVRHIIDVLEQDLAAISAAAKETYQAATNEESKPENKYDTRALEASYLAGAQAKRVRDLEATLGIFKTLRPKTFSADQSIESTALVEVELSGKRSWIFLVPARGSLAVEFGGRSIQVITPQSPLGEGLLGLEIGDVAKIDQGPRQLAYEVLTVE